MRHNNGFDIIAAVPISPSEEIVIGHRTTSIGESYVCWFCKNQNDYYWGKYSSTYQKAVACLIDRLSLEFDKDVKDYRKEKRNAI